MSLHAFQRPDFASSHPARNRSDLPMSAGAKFRITLVLLLFLATMCVIRHNARVAGALRRLNSWHDHSAPLLKASRTGCPDDKSGLRMMLLSRGWRREM